MTLLAVSFATPLGLLLALALIPLAVLFFLRPRRREQPVASTMLWARALHDTLASAPFRRPAEWLSLALLSAAIIAAALSLGGMRLGTRADAALRRAVVIDLSATMATRDGDTTRFGRALSAARDLVGSVERGDRLAIITAGPAPQVAASWTDERGTLRDAVDTLEPLPARSDLRGAVELAARELGAAGGEIVVLSDFAGTETLAGAAPPTVSVVLVPVGSPAPNAGITQVGIGNDGGVVRLVASIAARGPAGERTITLLRDGKAVDARSLTVPAEGAGYASFPVRPADFAEPVGWRLELTPPDALPLDDGVDFGLAPRVAPRVVVVGPDDPFLARLPATFPDIEFERVEAASTATTRAADLAIYVEAPPEGALVPAAVELWLGVLPPNLGCAADGELTDPSIVDWQRAAPLLRGVGLEGLLVLRASRITLPPRAAALVRTTGGTQLARLVPPGRQVLVWASAVRDSNLVLLPAFPILVRNLLGPALGSAELGLVSGAQGLRVRAGRAGDASAETSVRSPRGVTHTATLFAREDFTWPGRLFAGAYVVETKRAGEAKPTTRVIGVGLLDDGETTAEIHPPEAPGAATQTRVAMPAELDATRPLWRWCASVAALLLLAEAFVWLRRRRQLPAGTLPA